MAKKSLEKQTSKLAQSLIAAESAYGMTMAIFLVSIGVLGAGVGVLSAFGLSIPLLVPLALGALAIIPAIAIGAAVGTLFYRGQIKPEKESIEKIDKLTKENVILEAGIVRNINENSHIAHLIEDIKTIDDDKIVALEEQLPDDNLLKGELLNLKVHDAPKDYLKELMEKKVAEEQPALPIKQDKDRLNRIMTPVRRAISFFATTSGVVTTAVGLGIGIASLFATGVVMAPVAIAALTIGTLAVATGLGLLAAKLSHKIIKRNRAKEKKIKELTQEKKRLDSVEVKTQLLSKDALSVRQLMVQDQGIHRIEAIQTNAQVLHAQQASEIEKLKLELAEAQENNHELEEEVARLKLAEPVHAEAKRETLLEGAGEREVVFPRTPVKARDQQSLKALRFSNEGLPVPGSLLAEARNKKGQGMKTGRHEAPQPIPVVLPGQHIPII